MNRRTMSMTAVMFHFFSDTDDRRGWRTEAVSSSSRACLASASWAFRFGLVSYSPMPLPPSDPKNTTTTVTSHRDSFTSYSDSEIYDEVRELVPPNSKIIGTKNSKWGCGKWKRDIETRRDIDDNENEKYEFFLQHDLPVVRGDLKSTQSSRRVQDLARTQDSARTQEIVGSAFERKISDHESFHSKSYTTERLEEMRRLMVKDNLDY